MIIDDADIDQDGQIDYTEFFKMMHPAKWIIYASNFYRPPININKYKRESTLINQLKKCLPHPSLKWWNQVYILCWSILALFCIFVLPPCLFIKSKCLHIWIRKMQNEVEYNWYKYWKISHKFFLKINIERWVKKPRKAS